MPHHTEPSANNALGNLLQGMIAKGEVRSENTAIITGHSGLRPDILVTAPGRSPVVIEAEYLPAHTVEREAKERLGLTVSTVGKDIEAAVALRYPLEVREADDLQSAVSNAKMSYCVFTQPTTEIERFPTSGWLEGSVEDVADIVRLVSVPQRAVDAAATALQEGIELTAKHLDEIDKTRTGITRAIADVLGMENVPQTHRMAGAIVANALVFHERIVGMHEGIKPLSQVLGDSVADPKGDTLAAWTAILAINYWPIFAIAKDILEQLPAADASVMLRQLRVTAQTVGATGVDNAHDLTGRIFQRLIADRKYLATFYTLPASAALLARLAISKMEGVVWLDPGAIGNLRIADFACGTGALLSAVYEEIAARHERAGGDPSALHKAMMEDVLYGCDVMPSAVHITGSTLSGLEPSVGFGGSRLYTMPYGRQTDGTVKIGSLELLQTSGVLTLFNTSDPALRTGSAGEETAAQILADFPDEGFDLIIMNPPFTRATNHGGSHSSVINPAFAAFNASSTDQKRLGYRLNILGKGTCYHGNAGMASAFAALANRKLKPGGVLALVLPLVAAAGLSWNGFRQLITEKYTDLMVFSIAADHLDEMSFSADTGLGECLVIARKSQSSEISAQQGTFTSLKGRPRSLSHAGSNFKGISNLADIRSIAAGPYGGTRISVGSELTGEAVIAPVSPAADNWGAVRIADYSLAQTAYALTLSTLWLPGSGDALDLKTAPLGVVGTLGLVHRDITGSAPRGPFDQVAPSPAATYPALWNHEASRETRIVCLPDAELLVREGMEDKADEVWATASRAHLNLEFRFNSQALSAAITEQASLGGRSWPNVGFGDSMYDSVFAAWANSTLGMLLHWWGSSRQDSGRGITTIRAAGSIPVLDFRALTDDQIATAEAIFNEFRDKELQPAYLADADPNRALLDRRVICDLLRFDNATYEGVRRLAAKWCAEPSVHGGKKRPKGATLVM